MKNSYPFGWMWEGRRFIVAGLIVFVLLEWTLGISGALQKPPKQPTRFTRIVLWLGER